MQNIKAADEAHEIVPVTIEAVMAAKNCAVENILMLDYMC
jgi:hypothetical protein